MVMESCSDCTRREINKEGIVQKFLINHVDEKLLIRNGMSDCSFSVPPHGHVGMKVINRSFG